MSLPELIDAMEEAGTVDLRGLEVLPYMLDVVGTPSDPQLADAVNILRTGSTRARHRRDANQNGVYDARRRGPAHGRLVAASARGRLPAGAGHARS